MGGSSSGGGGGNNNNRKNKIVNALTPTPIKILQAISKKQKQKNKKSKSGDVYGGEAFGYDEASEKRDFKGPTRRGPVGGNGGDNQPRSVKSVEQPKVPSQMVAPKPMETPKGPTKTEMIETGSDESISANEEEELLKRKKKGRKSTVLTSVTGDTSYATLSKPTLLGG